MSSDIHASEMRGGATAPLFLTNLGGPAASPQKFLACHWQLQIQLLVENNLTWHDQISYHTALNWRFPGLSTISVITIAIQKRQKESNSAAAGRRHRECGCCGFPRFDGRTRMLSAAREGEDGRLHDFYAHVLPLRGGECGGRGLGRRWRRFWDSKRLDNHPHHPKRRPQRAHVLVRSRSRAINACRRCMSAGVGRERSGIGVNRATENDSLIYGCVGWF